MSANRIAQRFADLKKQGRAGLVTFITASDPDHETAQSILNDLPGWGADFVELGMPFSDPMADGPVIEAASKRALSAGASMVRTLEMVKSFRVTDTKTPLILMGYYNPIHIYGTERFARDAAESGADGLIIVDVPPEEGHELHDPVHAAGLDIIRLVTPTTDDARLRVILDGAGGFLYYVTITGVTGTASADMEKLGAHVAQIRKQTSLPLAAGFGIKTPDDVAQMARHVDAVVVGSAIVNTIAGLPDGSTTMGDVEKQVRDLAASLTD
mgnify:CR=1 FL=1